MKQKQHNSVVFCRKNAAECIFNLSFGVLDQNFVLSNQDGVLVGYMSFQEKKLFAALQLWAKVGWEVCINQHHQEAKKGKMW